MDGSTCDEPGYPDSWVVHVHGPDDLVPFDTRDQAEQCVAAIHAATNPHDVVAVHPLDPIITAHVIPPQNTTEHATDVRPVMPVVARAFDLDELDRFAAAGDWLPPGDGRALVAEVRRLREQESADTKVIGILSAAVAKAAQPTAGVVHALAGDAAHVERLIADQVESTALCGQRWVPTAGGLDGPVCAGCVRVLMQVIDAKPNPAPTLAELQARYIEVRQHTLSTDGLTGQELLDAEARYVLGEAWELIDAVEGLGAVDQLADTAGVDVDGRRSARAGAHAAVRHEIADVVLAATAIAGMLPGDVTVEACIAEKTEADRGRG